MQILILYVRCMLARSRRRCERASPDFSNPKPTTFSAEFSRSSDQPVAHCKMGSVPRALASLTHPGVATVIGVLSVCSNLKSTGPNASHPYMLQVKVVDDSLPVDAEPFSINVFVSSVDIYESMRPLLVPGSVVFMPTLKISQYQERMNGACSVSSAQSGLVLFSGGFGSPLTQVPAAIRPIALSDTHRNSIEALRRWYTSPRPSSALPTAGGNQYLKSIADAPLDGATFDLVAQVLSVANSSAAQGWISMRVADGTMHSLMPAEAGFQFPLFAVGDTATALFREMPLPGKWFRFRNVRARVYNGNFEGKLGDRSQVVLLQPQDPLVAGRSFMQQDRPPPAPMVQRPIPVPRIIPPPAVPAPPTLPAVPTIPPPRSVPPISVPTNAPLTSTCWRADCPREPLVALCRTAEEALATCVLARVGCWHPADVRDFVRPRCPLVGCSQVCVQRVTSGDFWCDSCRAPVSAPSFQYHFRMQLEDLDGARLVVEVTDTAADMFFGVPARRAYSAPAQVMARPLQALAAATQLSEFCVETFLVRRDGTRGSVARVYSLFGTKLALQPEADAPR